MQNNKNSYKISQYIGIILSFITFAYSVILNNTNTSYSTSYIFDFAITTCYFIYFLLFKNYNSSDTLISKYKRITLLTFCAIWITTSVSNITESYLTSQRIEWLRITLYGFCVAVILLVLPAILIAMKYKLSLKTIITIKKKQSNQ